MSNIELIERGIEQLDDKSFAAFSEWFVAYESARRDRQIEKDSEGGMLDSLVADALAAHCAGNTTAL